MKRFISWSVCLILMLSLAAPVFGAEEPEEEYLIDTMLPDLEQTFVMPVPETEEPGLQDELTQVILHVKEILDIDDSYTDFYGDYDNAPGRTKWTLNWSDETRQMSVTATTEGTIMSVYRWDRGNDRDYFYGFDPSFPALDRDAAEQQAQQWLEKFFTGDEAGRIDAVRAYLSSDAYYRFTGTVMENELESPVSFSMTIDERGLVSFSRSDNYSPYVGGVPSQDPAVSYEDGQSGLAGAVAMELYYVSDGEGGARLMYVPAGPYTIVDAQSGEVVDMDALYASFNAAPGAWDNVATMDAEEAGAVSGDGGRGLTDVELASIESYSSVMDKAAVDEALRQIPALGLEGFELKRCSYSMDNRTGDVLASLRYVGVMTEDQLYGYSAEQFEQMASYGDELQIYKYIYVDAVTGALRSVSTSYPLWEEDETGSLDTDERIQAAEDFLKLTVPEMEAEAALCTLQGYDQTARLVFTRTHDAYFYPENFLTVKINAAAGTVDYFSYTWDEEVDFAGTKGIVNEREAMDAYIDALEVTLGYAAWPIGLETEEAVPYADYLDWGYTYVEELRLAYYYSGTDSVRGVDALTGEAVTDEAEQSGTFVYTDLEDAAQKDMIEALAGAGIGFDGGEFKPDAELTQRDAVVLLLQAAGIAAAPMDDEAVKSMGISHGFLQEEDWDSASVVTRMDVLKMMLAPSRYGDAAQLTGIWNMSFLDVDRQDMGYAAIALALNMVEEGREMKPDETCTRGDAAAFLYNFMNR